MTTKKPHKPWRISGDGEITDFRGQPAAYDHVKTITESGLRAIVRHFEDGGWIRYEEIPAVVATPALDEAGE